MKELITVLGAVFGAGALLSNLNKAQAAESGLHDLFVKHAKEKGLRPEWLRAIAMRESSLDPTARNPADPSYGLMQIWAPKNEDGAFRERPGLDPWPPKNVDKLYDPDYNLHLGAQILRNNLKRFGTLPEAIALYNAYKSNRDLARREEITAEEVNKFSNSQYVRDVLNYIEQFKTDFREV